MSFICNAIFLRRGHRVSISLPKSSEQKHKPNRHLQHESAVCAIFSMPPFQLVDQVNTQWQSYASQLAKLSFKEHKLPSGSRMYTLEAAFLRPPLAGYGALDDLGMNAIE